MQGGFSFMYTYTVALECHSFSLYKWLVVYIPLHTTILGLHQGGNLHIDLHGHDIGVLVALVCSFGSKKATIRKANWRASSASFGYVPASRTLLQHLLLHAATR